MDHKTKNCAWVNQLRNFAQLAGDSIKGRDVKVDPQRRSVLVYAPESIQAVPRGISLKQDHLIHIWISAYHICQNRPYYKRNLRVRELCTQCPQSWRYAKVIADAVNHQAENPIYFLVCRQSGNQFCTGWLH